MTHDAQEDGKQRVLSQYIISLNTHKQNKVDLDLSLQYSVHSNLIIYFKITLLHYLFKVTSSKQLHHRQTQIASMPKNPIPFISLIYLFHRFPAIGPSNSEVAAMASRAPENLRTENLKPILGHYVDGPCGKVLVVEVDGEMREVWVHSDAPNFKPVLMPRSPGASQARLIFCFSHRVCF